MRPFTILAALGLLFGPIASRADPSPSSSLTSQPSCTTSAAVLVSAQPSTLHTVTIEQTSATAFYIGNASVTTSTGFLIPATQYSSYTISFAGPLYCITASGTATTSIIETVKGG